MSRSDAGEAIGGGVVAIGIFLILVLLWLTFQAAKLVLRTVAAHPHNKPLRVALAVALGAVLLAAVAGKAVPAFNALAGVALLALVATAWAVDLYYDGLFKREMTRERLVSDVLGSWW